MKRISILVLVLLAALLAGCYRFVSETPAGEELEITEADVSMEGNAEKQTVSYQITLQNNGERNVFVEWVRPYLEENVKAMLPAGADITIKVTQAISPGESLTLEGKFKLNTKGKKKAQIEALDPVITQFTVVTRRSLSMPVTEEEEAPAEQAAAE